MLREQREELWILAERITTPRSWAGALYLEAKPRPASCSTATQDYVDSIDVSELDFSAANLLTFSPSPFPANLISNFLAIAVKCGSIVLKNPLTVACR